jgi:nitrogen fixation protein NifX
VAGGVLIKELIMSRKWRVAVASLDGKVINEHFGRAHAFLIIDLAPDGSYTLVENRSVVPLCMGGEHTQEALESSVSALSDCTAVLVARIGIAAKRALELNRISVFEQPDFIDIALSKLAEYFAKINHIVPEE